MKIMFLDESGDHSLDKIDKSYPMFVLAGCIFDQEYYEKNGQIMNCGISIFPKLKNKGPHSQSLLIY